MPGDRRPTPASTSPTTTRSRSRPAAAAMAPAVSGWSPVTMMTSMPAIRAVSNASRIPSRIGSAKPINARTVQAPPSTLRATATSRSPAAACASTRADQAVRSSAVGWASVRIASGAPMASSSITPASAPRLRVRDQGRSSATGSLSRRLAGSSTASPPEATTARASDAVNEPGADPSALTQASSSARSASRSRARRSRSATDPPRSPTETTSSRLRVRVPVLSVMMRSIEPSVSCALSRRTRTPRRSSRYAPSPRITARRIGGSSGMAAMAAETPARMFAPASWPRANPSVVTMTMSAIATTSRIRTSRSSSAWSGERWRSRLPSPPEMRPTSDVGPMATTTPSPRPATAHVPAYAIP